MFYEAMENVLPDVKVVIESSDGTTSTILPLDSFVSDDTSSGNDSTGNNADDASEEE